MEITGENYHINYDPATTTVAMEGTLRLRGVAEYEPIVRLLEQVASQEPAQITLDLRSLQFLNSSGINVILKFVIKLRDEGTSDLVVQGTEAIPWQKKSLKNLQKLMPKARLEWH